MTQILTIPNDGTAVAMERTPHLGGHGRNAVAQLGANGSVTSGVILQGHNGLPADGTPAQGDSGWFALLSGVAGGNGPTAEIADLPHWVRTGSAATAPVKIQGIQ